MDIGTVTTVHAPTALSLILWVHATPNVQQALLQFVSVLSKEYLTVNGLNGLTSRSNAYM